MLRVRNHPGRHLILTLQFFEPVELSIDPLVECLLILIDIENENALRKCLKMSDNQLDVPILQR